MLSPCFFAQAFCLPTVCAAVLSLLLAGTANSFSPPSSGNPSRFFLLFLPPTGGGIQLLDGVDSLQAQASIYGDVLGACLSEESFDGFTMWGFTDLHSWCV